MLLLLFLEVLEDGVDIVKSFIYFLPDLGSSQNHLAADEDEEDNPRFDHPADRRVSLWNYRDTSPTCRSTPGRVQVRSLRTGSV